jgi:hypothetical protein
MNISEDFYIKLLQKKHTGAGPIENQPFREISEILAEKPPKKTKKPKKKHVQHRKRLARNKTVF